MWHKVELSLEQPQAVQAQAQVFIPPERCRYVVISDIDDTVMETGVANKLKMLWRLFVADAESRTAFPGVAALYRALHAGASGDQANPMLYVSRAPWEVGSTEKWLVTPTRVLPESASCCAAVCR